MIAAAIRLELRSLMRSPLRLGVVLLVIATGMFVLVRGEKDVDAWKTAVQSGVEKETEALEEARSIFATGMTGPEDRPWVDLSQPRWMDWYAGTRVSREPAPLAGIAYAAAEAGAVSFRINRFANPLLASGSKIENPALTATGGLDLVTVLTLLLPLMILALGVEIGGQERSMGILPLLRVQSGSDRSWIVLRCVAVGLVAVLVGVFLSGFATLIAGAGMNDFLMLTALILAYVTVWTALLTAVALIAKHPAQGAVALGAAWIALCVVLPAIGVERSAAVAAEDFALDLTVEARDSDETFADWSDDEVLSALFARFPALETLAPEDSERARRAAESGLGVVDLEQRAEHRTRRAEAQAAIVDQVSLASPAIAFAQALEGLAGRSPEADREYRSVVLSAVSDRMERYLADSWRGEDLTAEDFEEMVASSPAPVRSKVTSLRGNVMLLLIWAAALSVLAALISRRPSAAPARIAAESPRAATV